MRHLLLFSLLVFLKPGISSGQSDLPPRIRFDVPAMVTCREITTEEFANTHSLEKLLEVRLTTSSLLATGTDRCIRELFFFVYSPERSFEIVDFSPQTTLITEFASPIDESQNQENSNSAGLNLTPNLELAGKANITASLSDRQATTKRISRLPPKQLAVASGTQNRGTAVYFKMKPSTQLTLEGTQDILLMIKVPIAWRADVMHVHCSGITADDEDGPFQRSRSDFVVPIHLAADAPARIQCEELSRAERQLRKAAGRARFPSEPSRKDLTEQVSLFVRREILGKKEPESARPDWLGQVIFTNESLAGIQSATGVEFDAELQSAIRRFRQSRQQVVRLNR